MIMHEFPLPNGRSLLVWALKDGRVILKVIGQSAITLSPEQRTQLRHVLDEA